MGVTQENDVAVNMANMRIMERHVLAYIGGIIHRGTPYYEIRADVTNTDKQPLQLDQSEGCTAT